MAGKISKTLKSDGDVIGPVGATNNAVALFNGVTGRSIKNSSITETQLDTLTDNSIANTLHRHSELVASDGSPDPALTIDVSGNAEIVDGIFSLNSSSFPNMLLQRESGSYVDTQARIGISTSGGAPGFRWQISDDNGGSWKNTLFLEETGNACIGGTSPPVSALLELESITGALLLTRMTTTQKNALTAVNGMVLYDSTLGKVQKREGGAWVDDSGGVGGNDKQVQFNDGDAFAGCAQLFWDKTNDRLGIGANTPLEKLHIDGGAAHIRVRLETDDGYDVLYTGYQGAVQKLAIGYDDSEDIISFSYGSLGNSHINVNSDGSVGFSATSASVAGLYFDRTKNKLSVGKHWDAGYPFDSFQPAIEGISEDGEWGVLGASRSSDYGSTGSMRCLGLYGFVQNNSNTGAYGLYVEARKEVSVSTAATLGAEIVILNRYNSQVDVTPTSNPAQSTYGLSLTSGVTYDGVQDYDASVGLYFGFVGAKFRRGIVMSNAALRDHGGGKYIAVALPNSARICWVNDNNCIMGNATNINTLIANNVITQVTSAGFGVTGVVAATGKVQGGNAYIQNNACHLDVNDVVVSASGNNMYLAAGGTTEAILYGTSGNLSIGGVLAENAWTLNTKIMDRKWALLDNIIDAYKAHSGENLDVVLRTENNGRRPSDFIQIAIECINELHKRIEILEKS
jgi:hypothetical protein